jgi:hypothetical protein
MSSEILIKEAGVRRLKPDTTALRSGQTEGDRGRPHADNGLQPWQFFVLAALGLATAATFMVRGQGVIPVVMLSVLMGATAVAGFAALRLVRPLVTADEDRTPMIGERTRAALEREKMLALRAIKELDFDRAMGKLSESDWQEMSGRLRARATRLIRQLDAGAHYREQIERDVAKRLSTAGDVRLKPARSDNEARPKASSPDDRVRPIDDSRSADGGSAKASAGRVCAACTTANDEDARFCKGCGRQL